MEDIINELVGKYRAADKISPAFQSDEEVLINLRKKLDEMLLKKNQTFSMEIYTLVMMRAFRILKGAR